MCYNFAYSMHTRFSYIHSRLPVLYELSTCFVWVPVQIFGYGILVEIETSFRNEVLKNCCFFPSPKCLHLLFIVFQDFEGLLMCFILSFSDVCQLQELKMFLVAFLTPGFWYVLPVSLIICFHSKWTVHKVISVLTTCAELNIFPGCLSPLKNGQC